MGKMLKELDDQIRDIQGGSTSDLSDEFGHAIRSLVVTGEDASKDNDPEVQIARMRKKAEQLVIQFGPNILDHLRPELRALIEPEDLEELEKEHDVYLSLADT